MKVIQFFSQLFSKSNSSLTPAVECPNCWGRQEYEGEYSAPACELRIDLHNIDQRKGWIVAYATRKLNGFRS